MDSLIIVGFGGFGREIYWHAKNSKGYNNEFILKGYLNGLIEVSKESIPKLDLPVLGDVRSYEIQKNDVFVIAFADCKSKIEIFNVLKNKNARFINLIHNSAQVADDVMLGEGVILCPNTIISTNVKIGNHVMVNLSSTIGHDAEIGDYTSIMGHVDITGNVKVGEATYWGSGARALPGAVIESGAKIGAGSIVLKKVKEGRTVFGVPAMPI